MSGIGAQKWNATVEASCGFDVYFDIPNVRYDCGDWQREVQVKGVAQIIESFIFRCSLTGNIDLDALGDVPFAFLPYASSECLFHNVSAVLG